MTTLTDLQHSLKESQKISKKLTADQLLATQQLTALAFVQTQLNESIVALTAGKPDPHAAIRAAAGAVIQPPPPPIA